MRTKGAFEVLKIPLWEGDLFYMDPRESYESNVNSDYFIYIIKCIYYFYVYT